MPRLVLFASFELDEDADLLVLRELTVAAAEEVVLPRKTSFFFTRDAVRLEQRHLLRLFVEQVGRAAERVQVVLEQPSCAKRRAAPAAAASAMSMRRLLASARRGGTRLHVAGDQLELGVLVARARSGSSSVTQPVEIARACRSVEHEHVVGAPVRFCVR